MSRSKESNIGSSALAATSSSPGERSDDPLSCLWKETNKYPLHPLVKAQLFAELLSKINGLKSVSTGTSNSDSLFNSVLAPSCSSRTSPAATNNDGGLNRDFLFPDLLSTSESIRVSSNSNANGQNHRALALFPPLTESQEHAGCRNLPSLFDIDRSQRRYTPDSFEQIISLTQPSSGHLVSSDRRGSGTSSTGIADLLSWTPTATSALDQTHVSSSSSSSSTLTTKSPEKTVSDHGIFEMFPRAQSDDNRTVASSLQQPSPLVPAPLTTEPIMVAVHKRRKSDSSSTHLNETSQKRSKNSQEGSEQLPRVTTPSNPVIVSSPTSNQADKGKDHSNGTIKVPLNDTIQPNRSRWLENEINFLCAEMSQKAQLEQWTQGNKQELYRRLSAKLKTKTAVQIKNKVDMLQKTYNDLLCMAQDYAAKRSASLTKAQILKVCPLFEKVHPIFGDQISDDSIRTLFNRIYETKFENINQHFHSTIQIQEAKNSAEISHHGSPFSANAPNHKQPLHSAQNDTIHSKLLALQEQELRTKQVMAELEILRLRTWNDAFKEQSSPSIRAMNANDMQSIQIQALLDPSSSPSSQQHHSPNIHGDLSFMLGTDAFKSLLPPKSTDVLTSIQHQEFKARRALMELDLFRINSVLLAMEPPRNLDDHAAELWRKEVKNRYDTVKQELDRLRKLLESS